MQIHPLSSSCFSYRRLPLKRSTQIGPHDNNKTLLPRLFLVTSYFLLYIVSRASIERLRSEQTFLPPKSSTQISPHDRKRNFVAPSLSQNLFFPSYMVFRGFDRAPTQRPELFSPTSRPQADLARTLFRIARTFSMTSNSRQIPLKA